jgi:hypothetical protein
MVDWKKFVGPLIVGASVILVTPMLTGLVSGIAVLNTEMFGGLTIGGAIGSGLVAFGAMYVVNEYIMKM